MKPTVEKFKIIIRVMKLFKNWWMYPIVYLKLTKKSKVIFETKEGIKILIRVNSTDIMALTTVWLIEEYSKHNFKIKKTDTIIDVGAHIGLFSLYCSQICKEGKIYAFEPMVENYDILKSNIQLNEILNIKTKNCAISKSSSKIIIYKNNDESGHSKFIETDNPIEVTSKSLNDIFDNEKIEKCNLLKLDCEGSEYEIIDSLKDKNLQKIEKMVIEYHLADSNPELLENLKSKLKSKSYKISIEPLFDDIGFLYAIKKNED
jgi:FkbM family methyltransferase